MHTLVTITYGTWIQVIVLTKGTNTYELEILFILLIAVEGVFLTNDRCLSCRTPGSFPIELALVFIPSGPLCRLPEIIHWEVSIRRAVCADE